VTNGRSRLRSEAFTRGSTRLPLPADRLAERRAVLECDETPRLEIEPDLTDVAIAGLTADSRQVKPGFLFAALPGVKVDGSTFIDKALASGAAAVICAKGAYNGSTPVIAVDHPRRLLALAAARFYDKQPETIVAVTGTNGKTSVSVFVRQIWASMGFRAASLGTIGVVGPEGAEYLAHTTPDPVQLAELAAKLRSDGVKHLAVEASSHGLEQNRLDGLHLAAGAFTNLTRDHLDYHGTFENYFAAKLRLFDELLPQSSAAVINMDVPEAAMVLAHATRAGLLPFRVGRKPAVSSNPHTNCRHASLVHFPTAPRPSFVS